MSTEQVADDFQAFYRAQAPAVYALAVRHGSGRAAARRCVEAVFGELGDNWRRVSDPVRFSRRAAVLFLRSARRRSTRADGRRRAPRSRPRPPADLARGTHVAAGAAWGARASS